MYFPSAFVKKERTRRVFVSLICTTAPSTGLSVLSVMTPVKERSLEFAFFRSPLKRGGLFDGGAFWTCWAESATNTTAVAKLAIRIGFIFTSLISQTQTVELGYQSSSSSSSEERRVGKE